MPVLSELMADVEPSVSTERRRLTMAPALASVVVPDGEDGRDHGRQAGGDGRHGEGDGGQEERLELAGRASRPRPIEMMSATPAMTRIWLVRRVELLGERRLLGRGGLEHVRDVADLGGHARRGHEDGAGATGDLRVHEGQVDAVAERRRPRPPARPAWAPGRSRRSAPIRRSRGWPRGRGGRPRAPGRRPRP